MNGTYKWMSFAPWRNYKLFFINITNQINLTYGTNRRQRTIKKHKAVITSMTTQGEVVECDCQVWNADDVEFIGQQEGVINLVSLNWVGFESDTRFKLLGVKLREPLALFSF